MSLDEYIPSEGISENDGNGNEKASEISEKFKESVKKAGARIAKTRKDEKKAKKQDILLARFLVKIILNKKYDSLLGGLFELIDLGIPSNFLLGIMSLVYFDISYEIRNNSLKEKTSFSFKSNTIIKFDDSNLDVEIKDRINYWIEDVQDSVLLEYSSLMTKRLMVLLKTEEKIIYFIANVFSFFLKEINIIIDNKKALNIADFIIGELLINLKKIDLEEI